MQRNRPPQVVSPGKVLSFAPPARSKHRPNSGHSLAIMRTILERRRQLIERVSGRVWMVLAWVVAVERLQLAIDRREVFDAFDSLAFLVAVFMPVARVRVIYQILVDAMRRLHRGTRQARGTDEQDVSKSA